MIVKRISNDFGGEANLPFSKSISNRLLILREILGRKIEILNLSNAEDTLTLAFVLDELATTDDFIFTLDVGNCGTCMRFLTAFLSNRPGTYILTGNRQMQQRPIGLLVDALRQLGAEIAYINNEGFPPLFITGRQLAGGRVQIDCSISSQFASAIVLTAPAQSKGLEIKITSISSQPYLEMTLKLMEKLGLRVDRIGSLNYYIPGQDITPQTFSVPADWSSAAFWYAFVALSQKATVTLKDLTDCGLQGDAILYKIYDSLGVKTKFTSEGAEIHKKQERLDFFSREMKDYPDLAIPLIVNLVLLGISFRITGLAHLKYKETDRLKALQTELKKIGANITVDENDTVSWEKQELVFPEKIVFDTYQDHRLAMAFAQVAMFTDIELVDAQSVVKKSYPEFWLNFNKLFIKTKTI